MDNHKDILKYFCRLCGTINNKRFFNEANFKKRGWKNKTSDMCKEVFQLLYNVDINLDDDNIHPHQICSACKKYVTKVYNDVTSISMVDEKLKNIFQFKEHDNDCFLCTTYYNETKVNSSICDTPESSSSFVSDANSSSSFLRSGESSVLMSTHRNQGEKN